MVAVAALILLIAAVRVAVVAGLTKSRPDLASRFWPAHPDVLFYTGFSEIGQAVAAGRQPSPEAIDRVRHGLSRDPLAVEPLLVEGTRLLSAGETLLAERVLSEAAARDPRNPAARVLLAQLYLGEGMSEQGLQQLAALARRMPGAARSLVPAIAQFAKQPGAAPEVKALLQENPSLRHGVLETLAADPANTALILLVAGVEPPTKETPRWQARLLNSLLENEEHVRAYQLWARFSGLSPSSQPGLFNPDFASLSAPPPFNWTMLNGPGGAAEATDGKLHVLYYGREDALLVAQTLVLGSGRYRLTFTVHGSPEAADALYWVVTCLPKNKPTSREPIGAGPTVFTVPTAGCPAQKLELRGMITETPVTADVTISNLQLTRIAA